MLIIGFLAGATTMLPLVRWYRRAWEEASESRIDTYKYAHLLNQRNVVK